MKSRSNFFTDHPNSVGETYFEHFRAASGFGLAMVVAGFACLVHALVPALFIKTGSATIADLHERMVTKRRPHPTARSVPEPAE